jgi:hypothetical protein
MGLVSYAMGPNFNVIDLLGLANLIDSHLEPTPNPNGLPRQAGHDKPLPAVWLAALVTPVGSRPDPNAFVHGVSPAMIPDTTGVKFQEEVAWARAVLQCRPIVHLLDAADSPLGPSRFLRNIESSFNNTRLRIPPDPQTAYRKFCGNTTPADVRAARAGH